jgi:hypothetical protein
MTRLRPWAKERVERDSFIFKGEGERVHITEIRASPDREGWRRRVLNISEGTRGE